MKLEKYLDENGRTTIDKLKAKFLKIISYDDEMEMPIRSWTIEIYPDNIKKSLIHLEPHDTQVLSYFRNDDIKKAKVYVKNPSEAPQGVKLQEGKHGGKYYESETKTSDITLRMRNIESQTDKILQNYDKLSQNKLDFEEKIIFANNLLNLYNKNKKQVNHLDVPEESLQNTIQLLSSNNIHDKTIGIDNFMGLAHYNDLLLLSLLHAEADKDFINISDEELDDEWKWKTQLSSKIITRLNEIRHRQGLQSRTFRKIEGL